MMDGAPTGGDGRRRGGKKKNRQRRKRSNRGGRGQQQALDKFPTQSPFGDDRSVLGGRLPPATAERRMQSADGPPDAFALFCAYHLGITPSDGYQRPHLEDVSRRFGMAPKDVKALLGELEIDEAAIRATDFDLEGAKLDVRLAPEGISRTEVARSLWEMLLETRGSEG